MHVLLVTALLLFQAAGVAGFILGIYNYRQARKQHQLAIEAHRLAIDAPKLADQRKYREQLREVLYPVKRQCQDALITLKLGDELPELGDELPDHVPETFKYAAERLRELQSVLKCPGQVDMRTLQLAISKITGEWSNQNFARKSDVPGEPPSDNQKRRYDAARQELRSALDEAISHIDKCMKITVDEDNK